jgi:hypothetical protein
MNSILLRRYIRVILEGTEELSPEDLEGTKDPIEWIDSAKVSPHNFLEFWKADDGVSAEDAPFAAMELAAVRSGLRLVGKGSSRNVYELNDSNVIKLAINSAGVDQNSVESTVANDTEVGPIISKVERHDPDFFWIVSEKVKPLSENDRKEFEELAGIKNYADFINLVKGTMKGDVFAPVEDDIDKGTIAPAKKRQEKLQTSTPGSKCLKGKSFIDSVIAFVGSRYKGLLPGDITKIDSWGVSSQGCLVLFDYGISVKTFRSKYEHGQFSPEKARQAEKSKKRSVNDRQKTVKL